MGEGAQIKELIPMFKTIKNVNFDKKNEMV
jgi:hypothetical protein